MEIFKTLPGEPGFEKFINVPKELFPFDIVAHTEFAHINSEFLEGCYYLEDKNKLIGSIVLYNNPGHYFKGQRACCVGYFHCIENFEATKLMLNKVIEDVKKLGINYILGPMNGSTWESYRFKTSEQNPPFFLENNHPVFYNHLFKKFGFTEIQTYYSYLVQPLQPINDRVIEREKQFNDIGLTLRSINPSNYIEDMHKIYNLSLESFKNNLFYTPYKWNSFIEKYQLIESFVKPDMILIAEDSKDKTVGFIFTLDDIFCAERKQFVFKTYAVKPDRKYAGLGAVMSGRLTDKMLNNGYTSAIHAFVISGSKSANASSKGSEIYSEYKLYALEIK